MQGLRAAAILLDCPVQSGSSGENTYLPSAAQKIQCHWRVSLAINRWHRRNWSSVLRGEDKGPCSCEHVCLEKSRKSVWRRWPPRSSFLKLPLFLVNRPTIKEGFFPQAAYLGSVSLHPRHLWIIKKGMGQRVHPSLEALALPSVSLPLHLIPTPTCCRYRAVKERTVLKTGA